MFMYPILHVRASPYKMTSNSALFLALIKILYKKNHVDELTNYVDFFLKDSERRKGTFNTHLNLIQMTDIRPMLNVTCITMC